MTVSADGITLILILFYLYLSLYSLTPVRHFCVNIDMKGDVWMLFIKKCICYLLLIERETMVCASIHIVVVYRIEI